MTNSHNTTQNDALTQLVTLGRSNDEFGAVNPPTYRASTVLFHDFDTFSDSYYGKAKDVISYGRHGNPTTLALRDAMSALIDADHTILTPSGTLAITTALLAFLKQGDHILVCDSVYGPTRAFCDVTLKKMGISVTYYDSAITPKDFYEVFEENTKVAFFESPGSLTFEMQDVKGLAAIAKNHDCVTMLDYTWATPLYIKPFELGIDIAIQAVTKYVAGHSDVIMGAVSCLDRHASALKTSSVQLGNYVGGDEASLALRGLRTMAARLEMQLRHTREVISWLQEQEEVDEILYPALETSPDYDLWQQQMSGACSLFGIKLKDTLGREQVAACCNAFEHIAMGFSWGGYESLIVPFKPAEIRTATKKKWSSNQWIIRMHVGLESPHDIIADLTKGFEALRATC